MSIKNKYVIHHFLKVLEGWCSTVKIPGKYLSKYHWQYKNEGDIYVMFKNRIKKTNKQKIPANQTMLVFHKKWGTKCKDRGTKHRLLQDSDKNWRTYSHTQSEDICRPERTTTHRSVQSDIKTAICEAAQAEKSVDLVKSGIYILKNLWISTWIYLKIHKPVNIVSTIT